MHVPVYACLSVCLLWYKCPRKYECVYLCACVKCVLVGGYGRGKY